MNLLTTAYLPGTHCARQGDMGYLYEICRGMVRRIVPQVWGLVPSIPLLSPIEPQVMRTGIPLISAHDGLGSGILVGHMVLGQVMLS